MAFGIGKAKHVDELPATKAEWEHRIVSRAGALREARESGDTGYEELATQRLDSALDGYNRDVTSPPPPR